MKNSTFAFLFVLLTVCTFGQAKGKKTTSHDKKASASKLVGTWKLIEFANLDSVTNTWNHPYGKNPNGYFSYSKKGIVNINISSEIPFQIPKDAGANVMIDLNTFRQNYAVGYFGTYAADLEKQIVIHHVTGGTIPEYINTDQIRPFLLKNDTLTIGDNQTWKRVLIKVD